MSKLLIIFAQAAEAQSTLERTGASIKGERAHIWTEGHIPCCYQFDKGLIVISNVGLHSAQMSVSKYAHACDEVWNFGMAGSLQDEQTIGEITPIETVDKYIPIEEETLDTHSQACIAFTIPTLFLPLPCNENKKGGKLISSDFPIHTTQHRERLERKWDLVDMEGYGIAFASQALGKKCRLWKIISDFASPEGRELIRKHRGDLSEKMADKIMSIL